MKAIAGLSKQQLRDLPPPRVFCFVREENPLIVPAIKAGDQATTQMAPKQRQLWSCCQPP